MGNIANVCGRESSTKSFSGRREVCVCERPFRSQHCQLNQLVKVGIMGDFATESEILQLRELKGGLSRVRGI
jgi:hypothetical protein